MSEWKETEIGLIPKDWDAIKFEKVLEIPLKNVLNKPSRVRGNGYKMVNMNEIFAHDIIKDINMELVPLTEQEKSTSLLRKNDLLFARQSLVFDGAGKCIIFVGNSEDVCFEGHLIRARLNNKTSNPLFYYYFFSSAYGRRFIKTIIEQAVVAGIRGSDLKQLVIPYPPKKQQDCIAAILSCLDAKIENLRRQNETLKKIAQTLFKHWFIDFEFPFDFAHGKPNADGKPYKSSGGVMVPSELGDIPEGWRVGTLGDEFEILMGQSPSGSSFNENKQGIIFFQGRTDFGFRFPAIRLYTTEPSRIAEKFDVLVSVRAPVGDVNLASKKCCIGRGLAAVKSQYKSYCLHKIKSFKKLFNVFESEGTVFGSINKQSFNSLESIIPINKVIKDFEAIITTIDQKFYVNDLQIQTLTKIRDSLLPKLMSGQLCIEE